MNITTVLSPHFWKGRSGYTPKYIILHGTAGPGAVSWFQNPVSEVSAHYVIERDGSVVCCVDENNAAWANGVVTGTPGKATPDSGNGIRDSWWTPDLNPNLITISIEHTKLTEDNSDPLTPQQQTSSFALIQDIADRWGIPKRIADASGGITGHFSIDASNRTHCPGNYAWGSLWAFLGGVSTMTVPQGWHDDGQTLAAPNGIGVVRGFRQYVLANQWDKDNWPLQAEEGRNPLELSNPDLGGGTQQVFRWTTLEWTGQHGVFVAWAGEEILALRAEVAKLKASQTH
jgi:N-acetyl-anhydromuramyl-L-alanine amidase AmpD